MYLLSSGLNFKQLYISLKSNTPATSYNDTYVTNSKLLIFSQMISNMIHKMNNDSLQDLNYLFPLQVEIDHVGVL